MRAIPIIRIALLTALLGAGCEEQQVVDVLLSDVPEQVVSLSASVWLPGDPTVQQRAVTRSLTRFRLRLPRDASGVLRVTVDGLDRGGCRVAKGEGEDQLRGAPLTLSLSLSPQADGCDVLAERVGDGAGQVFAVLGDQRLPCAGSCSPPGPRPFAAGQQVTLVAEPAPGSYFAGWSGACAGAGDCIVTVAGAPQRAEAAFGLRRACEGAWCWDSPTPHGYAISQLWGASASDLWAVGPRGTLLHYNGSFWVRWPPVTDSDLHGVFGLPDAAPGEGHPRPLVWAVGERGTILRFDGRSWAPQDSGAPDGLNAVWARGPADAWAVGQGGVVLRWDGRSWSQVPSGVKTTLNAVWGTGPRELWIAGGNLSLGGGADEVGRILRFDGQGLRGDYEAPAGRGVSLQGLWGAGSPPEVWAVGAERLGGPYATRGVALRLRGGRWEAAPEVPAAPAFFSVWGQSARDLWIAAGAHVIHFDGGTYRRHGGTGWSDGTAFTLFGSAADNVWVGGAANTLLQWNGLSWARRSGGFLGSLSSLHGRSPQEVYAVGLRTELLRHDGELWRVEGGDPELLLYGVWVSPDGDRWYVGAGGAVFLRPAGQEDRWDRITLTEPVSLLAVWGSPGGDVWAVGAGGKILRLLRRAPFAEVSPSGTTEQLQALWGSGPRNIYAVGTGGAVLRYDGAGWRAVPVPTTGDLWGIWGSGASEVWIAGTEASDRYPGRAPVLLHFDGATWRREAGLPEDQPLEILSGIFGDGHGDLWVSSARGMLRRRGGRWTLEAPGLGFQRQLWGTDGEHLWGVGFDGAIVRRGPGEGRP